jgi:hypothetical protein
MPVSPSGIAARQTSEKGIYRQFRRWPTFAEPQAELMWGRASGLTIWLTLLKSGTAPHLPTEGKYGPPAELPTTQPGIGPVIISESPPQNPRVVGQKAQH